MPGFIINGSGGGIAEANGRVEIRRGYRWILQIPEIDNNAWAYLKSAARPNLTLGEHTQNHNQEVIYHIGKTTWAELPLTFYDIEAQPDVSAAIYSYLEKFTYNIGEANPQHPSVYKKTLNLWMLDHKGDKNEGWEIYHAWPKAVNWNALDYGGDSAMELATTWRYDRAQKVT